MSIIDASWIVNKARSFLGQNVTDQVDFKDEDILACLSLWTNSVLVDLKQRVTEIYEE